MDSKRTTVNTLGEGRRADKLILIGLVTFIVCNVVYDWFPVGELFENEYIKEGIWYWGQAFAFLCYSIAIWMLRKSIFTEILVAITFGQFLDEFIGDPLEPSFVEYIGVIGFIIYRWVKRWRRTDTF